MSHYGVAPSEGFYQHSIIQFKGINVSKNQPDKEKLSYQNSFVWNAAMCGTEQIKNKNGGFGTFLNKLLRKWCNCSVLMRPEQGKKATCVRFHTPPWYRAKIVLIWFKNELLKEFWLGLFRTDIDNLSRSFVFNFEGGEGLALTESGNVQRRTGVE